MYEELYSQYGSDNPAKLMSKFNHAGNETVKKLRGKPNHNRKSSRIWNSVEATKMVGVSPPTFRKLLAKYQSDLPGYVVEETDGGRKNYGFTLQAINFLRTVALTRYTRPVGSTPLAIAISNLKGGVGKTHTAVDLGKKFAIEGLRVLIIDQDAQGTATLIGAGLIPDLEVEYEGTITNALLEDPTNIHSIILKTHFDSLDIIPANLAIQDCDLILPNQERNNNKTLGSPFLRLKRGLELIKNNYDVILIDCGPNLGFLTINSILAVDGMIIPIPPNMNDYSSFTMFTGSLKSVFDKIPDKRLLYLRILISKHPGNNESTQMESMMRAQFGKYVLANYMCETVEISKAASEFSTIYDISKPRNSKETYQRALHHLDGVTTEILNNFKDIWAKQAKYTQERGGNYE